MRIGEFYLFKESARAGGTVLGLDVAENREKFIEIKS